MPSNISGSSNFNPSIGLAGISIDRIEEHAELPISSSLMPSDEGVETHLDQLFDNPSLDRRMLTAIRPQITNRELLSPVHYRGNLEGAHASLAAQLQSVGANSEDREVYQRALVVLEDEKSLQELFQTYRHALHQA